MHEHSRHARTVLGAAAGGPPSRSGTGFAASPDGMPVLARGKHRSPRQGACFMEFASYLAGERWSDRPACTDPALAALARLVNDWTGDDARGRLAPLIPSVVGLRPDHPATGTLVALCAASAALPIASESRQRVLAVGLLRCLDRLDQLAPAQPERSEQPERAGQPERPEQFGRAGQPERPEQVDGETTRAEPNVDASAAVAVVRAAALSALADAPLAERWARRQLRGLRPPTARTDTATCDHLIGTAAAGIAEACVSDPHARMRDLLAGVIRLLGELDRPSAERAPALPTPARTAGSALLRA